MTGQEALARAHGWGELAAVLYLLDTPLLRNKGVGHYVSAEKRTFDCLGLLEEGGPYSSGEYQLVRLACNLWGMWDEEGKRIECSPRDFCDSLSENNLIHALTAIAVYRGSPHLISPHLVMA